MVHALTCLQGRDNRLGYRNLFTVARVSPDARLALLDPKRPEAAQLDPITALQCSRDRVQDGVDDGLDVALVQMRVLLGDPLNQVRLDHAGVRVRDLAGSFSRDAIGFTTFSDDESRLGRIPACHLPTGGVTFWSTAS